MPEPPATINPEAVAELLGQLAFLSAVLGGFAATFLGTLLALNHRHATVDWAVSAAGVAAVGFILAAILGAFGSAAYNVEAPQEVLARRRVLTLFFFNVGLFPLLLAIGLSGWSRSRTVGVVTSLAALLGGLVALTMLLEG